MNVQRSDLVLEVKELRKYYGDVKAVDGVSFELRRGEVIAVLGPNGAGKTTTIEIVEGLRTRDSGETTYFGEFNSVNDEVKERMGVCFQENFFFEDLSVVETLRLYASMYRKHLPIEELLSLFGLTEKAKARVRQLSGGQRQRLAVALAFLNDPEIVFLDEPTVGLDPHARRALWDVIRLFKSKGKSIVLTTHYMDEAHQLSDRVYIMDRGRIIASGSPQELITSSGLSSVVEFPAKYAQLFEEGEGLNGGVVVSGELAFLTTQNVPSVIKRLFDAGVDNFVVRHPTLEDVFLKLTGRRIEA